MRPPGLRMHAIPFFAVADELGSTKVGNIVVLGALLSATGALPLEVVDHALPRVVKAESGSRSIARPCAAARPCCAPRYLSMFDNQDVLIYFNNQFVPLRDANVNILTHGLNYGTGVFEGIRGYWVPEEEELFLVRCEDHYHRWKANCRILRDRPAEKFGRTHRDHGRTRSPQQLPHRYLCPSAFLHVFRPRRREADGQHSFAIAAIPFGVYIDSAKGIHAGVASWRRVEDQALPARGKICGAYVNSVLATTEARYHGYDEAILLNENGHVAEGSTCNIFMVRHGKLITPPPSDKILEGLVRDCVITLARREMHMDVIERSIDRSELYVADELFFTGTAVEVAPITKVDHRSVGCGNVGFVTGHIRELYMQATRGRIADYHAWLHPAYQAVMAI
ncbi:MAG: branched-chain amino acid transaminase [Paludibaculum sp.]